jgi:hypothetical protein
MTVSTRYAVRAARDGMGSISPSLSFIDSIDER